MLVKNGRQVLDLLLALYSQLATKCHAWALGCPFSITCVRKRLHSGLRSDDDDDNDDGNGEAENADDVALARG